MSIFALEAPRYYAKGMSVIPLKERHKIPVPQGWQMFHDEPVPDNLQNQWIKNNYKGNIGLVLGEQSGVCVLDIDTDDEKVKEIVNTLLPTSPWKRVGKKGFVKAYSFNGTPTFRIKDHKGDTLVEHLSSRTQVVLPPSIHPDTNKPYVANCHLLDVVDELPALPSEIEAILRGALQDAGYNLSTKGWTKTTEFVSAGSRDVSMISVAGLLARNVLKGDLTFKQAVSDMRAWGDLRVEKVAGDDLDIEKGVLKIAEFVRTDVYGKDKQLPVGWDELMTDEEKAGYGLEFGADNEQWDYDTIMTYLKDNLKEHDVNSNKGIQVVEFILKKVAVASAQTLSAIQRGMILQFIKDASDKGMSISNLRAQIKEFESGPIEGSDHTEIAREVLKDLQRTSEVRCDNDKFWRWFGSHWIEVEEQEIRELIANSYGNLPAARRDSDHRGIINVIRNIATQGIKEIDIVGVNFANGVLTEEGELIEHKPEFGFTYTMPVRYMPEEAHKADKFNAYMRTSWGEDEDCAEKVAALQEALCATIFGIATRYQRAFAAYGVPKSGKSQLLDIVGSLVPEGSRCSIPPDKWDDRFTPANFHNKLVNIAGELSPSKPIKSDSFNMVIAGEQMTVDRKNTSMLSFNPKAAHWFGTNHPPKTNDTTGGFNRRWLYFRFDRPVNPKDVVPNLGLTIVAEEREAIMAWAVQALPRLKKNKDYTLPASHKMLVESVAGLNDSVRYFITQSGKVQPPTLQEGDAAGSKPLSRISDLELYTEYYNFCTLGEVARPVGIRIFRVRMEQIAATFRWKQERTQLPTGELVTVYLGLTVVKS